jgi:ATP/maltotriose-dependent transcriptional regulator MalT
LLSTARVLAEIALVRGDLDEAWQHASVLFADDHHLVPTYDLPLLTVAASILARRRTLSADAELDNAEAAVRSLLDAERFWPTWQVWSAQAEAEVGGDGTGNGVEEWRHAIQQAEHGPAHLRPYGLYRLGQALVASGDRAEARNVLREADAAARELGAGLITAQVAAFADRAGVVLADGTAPRAAETPELTAREQQVLNLIAQGLSNRQIGEKLFISAKTASVHVSAILRKLGASTRTEAVFLAPHELVG